MDPSVVQSHGHEYDEHHPHSVGSQQDEHRHDQEKKSALNKVKAKAKKIKDRITKHGHHDHDHVHQYHYEDQHIPDDHDLDEEDDEDEEMVEDPEVHGAPIYESATVKNATPGQVGNLGKPGVNSGGPTVMGEEPHHEPRVVVVSPTTEINQHRATDRARTSVGEEKTGQRKVNLERPMGLEEDPHAPGSTPEAYAPSNYQTKVTDPTGSGGAEIDITPVQKSFARMNVHNEPKPNPEPKVLPTVAETLYPAAGSHHQFVPELSTATKTHYPHGESHDQCLPELSSATKTQYPSTGSAPGLSTTTKTHYPSAGSHEQYSPEMSCATKTQYPSAGSHGQFVPGLSAATKNQYPSAKSHDQNLPELFSTTKTQCTSSGSHDQFVPELSSVTKTQYPSAGSHDQFAPEPIPTSTNPENTQATRQPFNTMNTVEEQPHNESTEKPSDQSSYTDKISSVTSAIADKAITAKNAVASKLGHGEKGDTNENETGLEEDRNEEKPSNQSSYTEKISSATSAIADKAVSAKNTIASKLGYGEKGDTDDHKVTTQEEPKSEDASTKSGSTSEYGKKIAGVGSAVKSKVPLTGTGTDTDTGMERESVVKEQDKGVSVKDYLAEKLSPADEDRALSEVISDTLHEKKEEPSKAHGEEDMGVTKVISDALHKGEEESERAEQHQQLGKVTESEEVKRRLGTGTGNEKSEKGFEESYVNSPGKGVVDKLKDAVGSWFGKAGENQTSQVAGGEHLSYNSGAEGEQVNQAAGERRLQESSN